MLVITHAVTGAVIGQVVRISPLAFIASVVVHFLMDMIPHGDSRDYEKYRQTGKVPKASLYQLIFDFVVVTGFIIYVLVLRTEANWWPIFWGILGGVLPDLMVGVHECKPSRLTRQTHWLHLVCHDVITNRWKDVKFRYAIVIQLLIIIVLMNYFF